MNPCRKLPERWNARGVWENRWHALFCPECRVARASDRKLAREVSASHGDPVPPGLEMRLLETLGLPAGSAQARGTRSPRIAWRPAGGSSLAAACGVAGAALITALLILASGPRTTSPPGTVTAGLHGTTGPAGPGLPLLSSGGASGVRRLKPRPGYPRSGSRHEVRLRGLRPQPAQAGLVPLLPRFRPAAQRKRGDLVYLNARPGTTLRRWARVSAGVTAAPAPRQPFPRGDDFVTIPLPRIAATGTAADRATADAVAGYRREAAVVDARLAHKVTLALKATALSDLCDQLRSDTGVQLGAGQSVADEKVTIFCREMPLREVMRQLSRPFGYTWLRSGKQGDYKYELTQDLRSQLLEEELRNRDRNAALIALEEEIERYRPYLGLTPDEALARSQTAAPAEKRLLQKLAGPGWGPLQMYYRLSRSELAALRTGQELEFSAEPQSGERMLPPEVARGVLQSLRDRRVRKYENVNFGDRKDVFSGTDTSGPEGRPLAAIPEARATVTVMLGQSELGQFTLGGKSGYSVSASPGRRPPDHYGEDSDNPLAVGRSPAVVKPENGAAHARLASDPALRTRVAVRPRPSCGPDPSSNPSLGGGRSTPGRSSWRHAGGRGQEPSAAEATPGAADTPALPGKGEQLPLPASGRGPGGEVNPEKVTTAEVLEALHNATGLPLVADHYTRLYPTASVSLGGQPLFDALNRLADSMRVRWDKDPNGGWLQFRSTSFYDDRIKEVPNRLLARWSASRQAHGALTLDDLIEIAQLPDAPLDAAEMAEGARECWGLAEWDLGRSEPLRPHLRYLAQLTPAQRQEAVGPQGLSFTRMSLAQQQRFIALAIGSDGDGLQSLDDLTGAVMRVDYTQPGWYEWRVPGPAGYWLQWVIPLAPGEPLTTTGRRAPRPPVRERTREAALQAARRIDPQLLARMVQANRRFQPGFDEREMEPQESQIVPTGLDLTILYLPGASHARCAQWTDARGSTSNATW